MSFVGVDGCQSGWFSVALDESGWSFAVDKNFDYLWSRWSSATAILVDIPIGLRNDESVRICDVDARKLLGNRRSSVFPAPRRAALGATSHSEAAERNRHVSGKGLSQQTFHILHKIAEVDTLLRADRRERQVIREVHPEILFWALNDGEPMAKRKKRSEGVRERVAVLECHYKGAAELIEQVGRKHPRHKVARDDIVDALAAAVTARMAQGDYRTLPENVETDQEGLRMEMVSWWGHNRMGIG